MAHRVIANCQVVRNQLIAEGVNPARIVQHYNGLDLDRVRTVPGAPREEARAKFGLPEGRRFITIVANLHNPVKDHPMFLRAAARVHASVSDAAFIVAGEGVLMEDLRTQAEELGVEKDIFFVRRCDDVASLLFASDIGVLSSKAEGFANAILEYMAAGLPVVATDVGGAREAIVEGETGFLVSSGDDLAMAERIIRLLKSDKMHVMGERGRAIVESKFSAESHLQNTLQLYDELLSAGKRVPTKGEGANRSAGALAQP